MTAATDETVAAARAVDDERITAALRDVVDAGETGVQVAASVGGRPVVSVWAGEAVDAATLFPIFSVTKAFTATAVHRAVAAGTLDPDEPIAAHWPNFAVGHKSAMTPRHVLMHRSGLPQMPNGIDVTSVIRWDAVTRGLAGEPVRFAPGTTNAYGAQNFGWLLGEVLARTDPRGRRYHAIVRDEVLVPLGLADVHVGVPAGDVARVARLSAGAGWPPAFPPGVLAGIASPATIDLVPEIYNRPDILAAGLPSTGAVGTAEAVCGLFAMLACTGELDGARYLPRETVVDCLRPRDGVLDPDLSYGRPMPVGRGGYWVGVPGHSVAREGAVLAHTGAGGTVAWGEPDTGFAVAVCHARMVPGAPFGALVEAVRTVALELAG